MQIKNLLDNDEQRAVSPVIGVILMVAITVILAAVIGTFVLGLGDQVQQTAPNANFNFDHDSDGDLLTVTHDGGDAIEAQRLSATGDIAAQTDAEITASGQSFDEGPYGATSSVTAGSSIIVGVDGSADATVRIVWTSSDGDRSSTMARWDN